MGLSGKDTKAIAFVSGLLNQIVHVHVSPDLITAAAVNQGDLSAMWHILIDLTLIHVSGLPDEPQRRLYKLWSVLAEEGHDDIPVEGAHSHHCTRS